MTTSPHFSPTPPTAATAADAWSPESWKRCPTAHQPAYPDAQAVETAVRKLRSLPPLVTSWEIERLKSWIAEAQAGRRFLLQGGDCAETLSDCTSESIANKLKILLQMSLVLVQGAKKPVIRVGRFAGQYAKPRTSLTETRQGVTLPSYFGDLINNMEFTAEARRPNPHLMVRGYQHAAMTLNFIRSLIDAGFADLHHPEYWDLGFCDDSALRSEYLAMVTQLSESVRFMETIGGQSIGELTRVEFFTSHEGLNLLYESAGTRTVPRRDGYYNLTTHMPWIGDRSRDVAGGHIEYFRGIRNPIGIKVGPTARPDDILTLIDRLNPGNEAGRIVLIHRMGAQKIGECLPPILNAIVRASRNVLWVCDAMHGNTRIANGQPDHDSPARKTRSFDDIVSELNQAFDIHKAAGTILGGVHFELTGEHVTECIGGARGLSESDLQTNYRTQCDPRLNYEQALELALLISRRLHNGE